MKLQTLNESQLQGLKQKSSAQGGKELAPGQAKKAADEDSVSFSTPVRVGGMVLRVSLERYLQIDGQSYVAGKEEQTDASDEESSDNPLGFDYESVADNVMAFVSNAIRYKQADGADEAKLQEMLAQARKGIDMGFDAARQQLGDLLDQYPDVNDGIDKSYELLQSRMDEFEKSLFGQDETETTDDSATEQTEASQATGAVGTLQLRQRQSLSVELTTKDGDKVTVAFDDQQQWRLQSGGLGLSEGQKRKALAAYGEPPRADVAEARRAQPQSGDGQYYYGRTTSFSFSVSGELDQQELGAIGDLLGQIADLSDSFFGGDLQAAQDKAAELNWDDQTLVSATTNLKQQQSAQLAKRYGSDAPSLEETLGPLADYLGRMEQMLQNANTLFDRPTQDQATQWVLGQQQGLDGSALQDATDSFTSYNDRLHQALSLLG